MRFFFRRIVFKSSLGVHRMPLDSGSPFEGPELEFPMLVDPDVMCLICSEHVLLQDSYQV